jgi:dTDP-4-amino-4,6-dideoxygalactose transaminase
MVTRLATGKVVDGPDLDELRSALMDALKPADLFLCDSGSAALELALRACGVGPRDQVVIPTFCCSALVSPIIALGAVPVLADVGPELNITRSTVEAVLGKPTKAIIVPHLFGNPADIGSIIELVKHREIAVIDDAAQALGATIDGRPLGSFGDFGIISFGREKVCSGLGGGALIVRNRDLAARIDGSVLATPSAAAVLRDCLAALVWRRWRRWTRPLESTLALGKDGPDAAPNAYRKVAMANLNAAVALSLVRTWHENVAARRARVRRYRELLGDDQRLRLIPHQIGSACLTQVVRFISQRCGDDIAVRVIETLGREGYEVQGSYVPIHLLPGYEQCVWDRLPHAESIWPDLIELPCEPTVDLHHVTRIAAIIKDTLPMRE